MAALLASKQMIDDIIVQLIEINPVIRIFLRHKITQMKKQSFLLLAGALLTITACNTTNDNQYSEAQIDSMVNARVDEMRLQMMAQNDSMINALAAQVKEAATTLQQVTK